VVVVAEAEQVQAVEQVEYFMFLTILLLRDQPIQLQLDKAVQVAPVLAYGDQTVLIPALQI
jgi:hypothetical protein